MKQFLLILIITLTSAIFSENIHPNFTISSDDLKELYTNEKLFSYDFLHMIHNLIVNQSADLQLVDKTHRLKSDYIPDNLVNLADYGLHTRHKEMLFTKNGADKFLEMANTAKKEDIDLFIASTYRTYQFQDKIFNNMKNYHGEEKASTIVAYPGASQHQLGTGVDFGTITPAYAYTDAGKWLLKNSWKFGFTLSYPEGMEDITSYMWEPWHYRYIGYEAALVQREYFQDVQQYFIEFWDKYSLFFIKNHIQ